MRIEIKRLPPTLQKVVDFLQQNPDGAYVEMVTGAKGGRGQRRWYDVAAYDPDARHGEKHLRMTGGQFSALQDRKVLIPRRVGAQGEAVQWILAPEWKD